MGDIISYVKQSKNMTFEDIDFTEVDSLVLSELSYCSYENTLAEKKEFTSTLEELFSNTSVDAFVEKTFHPNENTKLIKEICSSKRFGQIKVGHYVNRIDKEIEKQFSAMTFQLDESLYYIAFRGTDETFVGWKEDLNLFFMEHVPAQKEALQYFLDIAAVTKGKYILGGHSKGGNLSVYTAMSVAKEYQEKIIKVYDHDGPGFLNDTFSDEEYLQIKPKLRKTIPQTAFVGLLLEQHQKYQVVKSKGFLFSQHNPFAWIVTNRNFVILEETDIVSKVTKDALNNWLNTLDLEERKLFVNTLYELVKDVNVDTFSEFIRSWRKNIEVIYDRYQKIDPDMKKMLEDTIDELIKASKNEMKNAVLGIDLFKEK